uniref:Uncharacterized protein n=1 Tax=Arundo donax TaxID=35708 RepID=A0A0A9A5I1_ARUDO
MIVNNVFSMLIQDCSCIFPSMKPNIGKGFNTKVFSSWLFK